MPRQQAPFSVALPRLARWTYRGPAERASNSCSTDDRKHEGDALRILAFARTILGDFDNCSANHQSDGNADDKSTKEQSHTHQMTFRKETLERAAMGTAVRIASATLLVASKLSHTIPEPLPAFHRAAIVSEPTDVLLLAFCSIFSSFEVVGIRTWYYSHMVRDHWLISATLTGKILE